MCSRLVISDLIPGNPVSFQIGCVPLSGMFYAPLSGFWHRVPLAALRKTFVPPWCSEGPGASSAALGRLSSAAASFASPCTFHFRTWDFPGLRIYEPAARLRRYLAGVLC